MTRLFAAVALLIAAVTPVFACEWDKSAAADTRSTTVASQSGNAPHSKPAEPT